MKKGFCPFLLGKGKDYWGDASSGTPFAISQEKQTWYISRGKAHRELERDFKKGIFEEVTKRISTAIIQERTSTRKTIEAECYNAVMSNKLRRSSIKGSRERPKMLKPTQRNNSPPESPSKIKHS